LKKKKKRGEEWGGLHTEDPGLDDELQERGGESGTKKERFKRRGKGRTKGRNIEQKNNNNGEGYKYSGGAITVLMNFKYSCREGARKSSMERKDDKKRGKKKRKGRKE